MIDYKKIYFLSTSEKFISLIIIFFVGFFSFFPLVRLFFECGKNLGDYEGVNVFIDILTCSKTWNAIKYTLIISIGGTTFSLFIGVTLGICVELINLKYKSLINLLIVLPLIISPQVLSIAWLHTFSYIIYILNTLGVFPDFNLANPLYSLQGMIFLLGVHYTPFIFLSTCAGFSNIPRELIEAAQTTGATRGYIFRTIILPLISPSLIAGISITFISCMGNFGIPALLGIPKGYIVLSTFIYQHLSNSGVSSLAEISILSVFLIFLTGILMVLQNKAIPKHNFPLTNYKEKFSFYRENKFFYISNFIIFIFITINILPIICIFFISLLPAYGMNLTYDTLTLEHYKFILLKHSSTHRAIINSFFLSTFTALTLALISIPMAYLLIWKKFFNLRFFTLVIDFPYVLPGIVLSISYILIFISPVPIININIYNTFFIIYFAYLSRFFTLQLRPLIGAYQQFNKSLNEEAEVFGAGFIFRLRTIIIPLIFPSIVVGTLLVFLSSFSELTVSALLWSPGIETLGVNLFNLEQSGNINAASALAVLIVVSTVFFIFILNFLSWKINNEKFLWIN